MKTSVIQVAAITLCAAFLLGASTTAHAATPSTKVDQLASQLSSLSLQQDSEVDRIWEWLTGRAGFPWSGNKGDSDEKAGSSGTATSVSHSRHDTPALSGAKLTHEQSLPLTHFVKLAVDRMRSAGVSVETLNAPVVRDALYNEANLAVAIKEQLAFFPTLVNRYRRVYDREHGAGASARGMRVDLPAPKTIMGKIFRELVTFDNKENKNTAWTYEYATKLADRLSTVIGQAQATVAQLEQSALRSLFTERIAQLKTKITAKQQQLVAVNNSRDHIRHLTGFDPELKNFDQNIWRRWREHFLVRIGDPGAISSRSDAVAPDLPATNNNSTAPDPDAGWVQLPKEIDLDPSGGPLFSSKSIAEKRDEAPASSASASNAPPASAVPASRPPTEREQEYVELCPDFISFDLAPKKQQQDAKKQQRKDNRKEKNATKAKQREAEERQRAEGEKRKLEEERRKLEAPAQREPAAPKKSKADKNAAKQAAKRERKRKEKAAVECSATQQASSTTTQTTSAPAQTAPVPQPIPAPPAT